MTLQEFLFEAAGRIREFRHGQLVLSVNRHLHVVRSIRFRRHHTKALVSSPGFSEVLSLSELYILYKRVPSCSELWRRRVETRWRGRRVNSTRVQTFHKLGEMVNDTAFELLRCSVELKKFTSPQSWSNTAIAFLSCTIFWVTVDAAASSL